MPIDPVKIPQNVQIEDRVVGPLSLRQLILIMLGGGVSYVIYAFMQKSFGAVNIPLTIIAWIPCAIMAAFAVIRINDLSLMRMCFLLMEKMQKPSVRTWGPRKGIAINIRTSTAPAKERKNKQPVKTDDQIAKLSSLVDGTMESATAIPSAPSPAVTVEETIQMQEPQKPEVTPPSPAAPRPPVDPNRVSADAPSTRATPAVEEPHASNLSVFRDIFPSAHE